MAETFERVMEVTGLIRARDGARFEVTDTETGEKFRWLPEEAFKQLKGLLFGGTWTTYRAGAVNVARQEG